MYLVNSRGATKARPQSERLEAGSPVTRIVIESSEPTSTRSLRDVLGHEPTGWAWHGKNLGFGRGLLVLCPFYYCSTIILKVSLRNFRFAQVSS